MIQAQHKSHEFKAIRAKYIILLFYYTGLTVSEVSNKYTGAAVVYASLQITNKFFQDFDTDL